MSWLLRDGDVLAAVEDPRRGWPATLHGAVLLSPPAFVHTLRVPVALDLAWCVPTSLDGDRPGLVVRRIRRVGARRAAAPHLRTGRLVVATAGSFDRWRLHVGDLLEVRPT